MKQRGNQPTYSAEVAARVCEQLAAGRTLRDICRDEGMPPESTVRTWALDDREGFAAQFTRAREIGAYSMVDEIVEISDDGRNDWMERNGEEDAGYAHNGEHVNRSKLRVESRKWLASKVLPKVFGDKMDVNHAGAVTLNVGPESFKI
jgi:hypothetical protein